MRHGFFTASKFKDIYLNELDCKLCGSRHAVALVEVKDETK